MQNSNAQGNLANEVKNNLAIPQSDNLLDFINSNLKVAPAEPKVDAAQAAAQTIANANTPIVEVKAPLPETPKVDTTPDAPDVKINDVPKEVPDDIAELLDIDGKESFKGLRQKVTRAKNELEETKKILLEKETYIEKIKKGEEEIEPLKVLKEENQKLAKYRDMYDLETSPDYISQYVEPINQAKEELKKYAEEYSVPIEELESILDSESISKTNKFLSEHFDAIGGVQVKSIIDTIKSKRLQQLQARETPRNTLERLKNDSIEAMRAQEIERVSKINTNAHTSWTKTLTALQSTGKYPELTFRGDPTHDEYVKTVMENAASRYGSIVTKIANLGLKDLPEDLANEIAAVCSLSEASGAMAESRDHIFNEHLKVVGDARRRSNFESPPLGGFSRGGTGGSSMPDKGPSSPMDAGQEILRRIGMGG